MDEEFNFGNDFIYGDPFFPSGTSPMGDVDASSEVAKPSSSPKKGERRSSREDGQTKRTRASGEILTFLMTEFNRNSNPTTAMRKQIALKTGMPERSVRIWFQNRRAKARKMEKLQKGGSIDDGRVSEMSGILKTMEKLPIEINEKYNLIECKCLNVGSWQRIRSGNINADVLNEMINLSPKLLNKMMDTTDLLVILSKKDQEINYFFSGVFQNDKVLFRIFYPIINIVKSSILSQSQQPGEGEIAYTDTLLQIDLANSPKFAVHFLRDPNTGKENVNQWSICEDFSEGQQVASAHIGEGGTQIGHILTGHKEHLNYLNTWIMSALQSATTRGESLGVSHIDTEMTPLNGSGFPGPDSQQPINNDEISPLHTSFINNDFQADQLHDLLLYNSTGANYLSIFNGVGIDSESTTENRVDSSGLDIFRNGGKAEIDDIDINAMLGTDTKQEFFDDDFSGL
ncbi:Pho2 protein [Martiniozyma asiatica (nom. inval.)]|nr:Pho2 protein [Martiniozyma asiatica]